MWCVVCVCGVCVVCVVYVCVRAFMCVRVWVGLSGVGGQEQTTTDSDDNTTATIHI